jgi:hypothetical protein
LDGGVWQLENGACIYESRTFNLSKKEQEEPSRIVGVVKRTNRWNHRKGIRVLLKRWKVVPFVKSKKLTSFVCVQSAWLGVLEEAGYNMIRAWTVYY